MTGDGAGWPGRRVGTSRAMRRGEGETQSGEGCPLRRGAVSSTRDASAARPGLRSRGPGPSVCSRAALESAGPSDRLFDQLFDRLFDQLFDQFFDRPSGQPLRGVKDTGQALRVGHAGGHLTSRAVFDQSCGI